MRATRRAPRREPAALALGSLQYVDRNACSNHTSSSPAANKMSYILIHCSRSLRKTRPQPRRGSNAEQGWSCTPNHAALSFFFFRFLFPFKSWCSSAMPILIRRRFADPVFHAAQRRFQNIAFTCAGPGAGPGLSGCCSTVRRTRPACSEL